MFFEAAADPHEGAGGAHAGDKGSDVTAGPGEDLGAGGFVMAQPVVRVGELVGHEVAVRVVLQDSAGLPDGAVCALVAGSEDQLGAVGEQGLAPLHADAFGQGQLHSEPLAGADHGQTDSGISGGRLQDDLARLQVTVLFGSLDHPQGGPVLDRAARVVALEFGDDAGAVLGADPSELYKRGVADRFEQAGDTRGGFFCLCGLL